MWTDDERNEFLADILGLPSDNYAENSTVDGAVVKAMEAKGFQLFCRETDNGWQALFAKKGPYGFAPIRDALAVAICDAALIILISVTAGVEV